VQFDDLIYEMLRTFNEPPRDWEQTRPVGKEILVWKMRGFGEKDRAERAIKQARDFKTLIVDLRGNAGGLVDTLERLVSLSFDRPVVVGVETTREGTTTMTAKPAKDAFKGRIIVLVDSESASAAEMYARLLQIEKRAVVIGDRTAGAVMTSRMFPHTVGIGRIAFYGTSITVGDVRMSDGSSLEHVGVTPDIVMIPTAADLAARRDPVLARAIAEAGGQMSPDDAGRLYGR
jgi:carboxyl-terminal processing protease